MHKDASKEKCQEDINSLLNVKYNIDFLIKKYYIINTIIITK